MSGAAAETPSGPRTLLHALVLERHLTRFQLVDVLERRARSMGITDFSISERQIDRWFAGRVVTTPRPSVCRVLEAEFGYTVSELFGPDLRLGPPAIAGFRRGAPAVEDSQEQWRSVRKFLNGNRGRLAKLASSLYQSEFVVPNTSLLAHSDWLPPRPVLLEEIELVWETATRAAIDGTEPEARARLPMRTTDYFYDRYTAAIRYLEAPTLFENRPSYRLVQVGWGANGGGTLSFGAAAYFDKLDISEALGHEFAATFLEQKADAAAIGQIGWRHLPFRRVVGDPFDLASRAVIPAITTLTLIRRADGTARFLLHWRDPAKVATAGGMYDVVPAGEFQPSSVYPDDTPNDFDLWRNMVREFSEELLGAPEHDGSRSQPIDYDHWPLYRGLSRARAGGALRAFCFGVGVDALTLAATIPTVVVIDEDAFEELFGEIVGVNAEGIIVARERDGDAAEGPLGLPFDVTTVNRFLHSEPIAPPGAACLALAWRNREQILAR